MVAVEVADVDTAVDATDVPGLGVLPEGVAHGGGTAVVGDEDVVLTVFLSGEVSLVEPLAGVDHRLDTIVAFHELENFVDTLHIEAVHMMSLDVEDRDKVLFFLFDHLAEVRHLLVGSGLTAIEVIAADKETCLASFGNIILVEGILDGGTLRRFDVDEFYRRVLRHLGPVDGALKLGDINATGADLSLHIAGKHEECKECEECKLTFVFHHR